MNAFGFTRDDFDDVEVWPENWPVFHLFSKLSTQWTAGVTGPIGLRYDVVFQLLDRMSLESSEWWHMFDDLRTMEQEARETMGERRVN